MFTYIDSYEDLSFLNKELLERPFVGVDTEFRRTTKDNMKLALLQINDGDEIYLIDPLFIKDPKDQCSFLFSESVIKVFHSCKEDIEAIYSWAGDTLLNLFDTQLAEAFLNGEYSIGYQGLVEKRLGIILDKKETRSNWIRRPLTDAQLKYAASDVEFLIHLFLEQEQALISSNKISWFIEEMEFMVSNNFNLIPIAEEYENKLSKTEEKNLLNKFNECILDIAKKERINPTLFFSKRNQKEFIRTIQDKGLEEANSDLTLWRSKLIKHSISNLFKEYI